MKPLFTYPISNSPWLVVIMEQAGHFYYNRDSESSVWQLADTGITDFSLRVDFNHLALLFGKANGLAVSQDFVDNSRNAIKKKKTNSPYQSEAELLINDTNVEPKAEEQDTAFSGETCKNASIEAYDYAPMNELNLDSVFEGINRKNHAGLSLGYSSSDSHYGDSDEEHDIEVQPESKDNNDSNDHTLVDIGNPEDITAGIDLGFSSENDVTEDKIDHEDVDCIHGFLDLLDEHSAEISIFDPWFVVEEELLPKFSMRPEYYGVEAGSREELYNNWAISKRENGNTDIISNEKGKYLITGFDEKKNKQNEHIVQALAYPSAEQLFFQFLQEHKSEVKKQYYSEFLNLHREKVDTFLASVNVLHPEELYRKLRVTLNDSARVEKEMKQKEKKRVKLESADISNSNAESKPNLRNVKVSQVQSFLSSAKLPTAKRLAVLQDGQSSAFNQWVQICNHYGVPSQVANNPANFILGDEKRLQCYKEYFNIN